MGDELKIIFVFVDGLGIGCTDTKVNPLRDARFPNLAKLLFSATPLDACLGVDGLPQSATGQTTLVLLCSDHGNIEDLSTFSHTQNPVPLVALGTHAERFRHLEFLDDVVPAILEVL